MFVVQTKYDTVIRFSALIAALSLTQGWLAGNRALASCGDYVTVGGSHGGGAHGRDMDPSAERSGDSQQVPLCSGPQCQRNVPPPAAPKPLLPTGTHESAYARAEAVFTGPERSILLSEPMLLASQAVILPPDRPPRPSL